MKKLVLFAIVVVSAILTAVPLVSHAQTQPTGPQYFSTYHWIDANTIDSPTKSDGSTDHYVDGNLPDGDWIYINNADPALSCNVVGNGPQSGHWVQYDGRSLIDLNDGGTNNGYLAHFIMPPPPGKNCVQNGHPINISDGPNRNISYYWVDQNTIKGIPNGHVNSDDGDTYVKTGKYFVDTQGNCPSFFTIASDNKSGQYTQVLDTPPDQRYGGDTYHEVNGCWWDNKTIPRRFAYVDNATKAPSNGDGNGNGGGGSAPEDPCANAGGSYAWILCPAVDKAQTFLQKAYSDVIQPLLQVDPLRENNALAAATKLFIDLADVFLVIIFLVMIFGTSFNMNSYTAKKVLPRIIIAAIVLQFSFFLCGIVIDVGNVFGDGLQGLVVNALSGVQTTSGGAYTNHHPLLENFIAGGTAAVALGAGIGAIMLLGPAVLLLILGFVLSILTFLLTLILRKLLIDILVLLAPLAILAWVLPNTEGLFNKWRSNFIKTVMVYPMISIILCAGYIVQVAASGAGGGGGGFVNSIIGILAPMISFFLAPMGLKWGSQMLLTAGRIGSQVTGLSAGRKASMAAGIAPMKTFKNNLSAARSARNKANLDAPGFKGFRARRAAGVPVGFGLTSGSRAVARDLREQQLASARAEMRSKENKKVSDMMTAMETMSAGQLAGSVTSSSTPDVVQSKAAIALLAKQGKTEELAQVKAHMESVGMGADYAAAMKTADVTKIREKAPQLLGGNPSDHFKGITADRVAKLDETGAKAYMDHLQKQSQTVATAAPGSQAHTEAQRELQGFVDNINKISASPTLSASARKDSALVYRSGVGTNGAQAFDATVKAYVSTKTSDSGGYV